MNQKTQRLEAAVPPSIAPVAVNDIVEDKPLRRREAAQYIGVSESTLRRLEGTVLHPTVENGVHLLLALRLDDASGVRIAAAAFEAFDRKLGPVEVVKLLRIPPAAARELFHQWANLEGCLVVEGEAFCRIERVLWINDEVRTSDDLARALEEYDAGKCLCCKRRPPRFCACCCVDKRGEVYRIADARLAATAKTQSRKRLEDDVAERARSVGEDDSQEAADDSASMNTPDAGGQRVAGRRRVQQPLRPVR
jgi:hypothetical protein